MTLIKRYIQNTAEFRSSGKELWDLIKETFQHIKAEPYLLLVHLTATYPLCILAYLFHIVILFVILLYETGKSIVLTLKKWSTIKIPLSMIYTPECIKELMCTLLQENYKELGIHKPTQIKDILPVKHPLPQMENGFSYYRFIVSHPINTEEPEFDLAELLNLKLSQHLQVHFSNCQILYEDVPVLTVFRISESLHHPQCYDINVMLIDSTEKINFLKSLDALKIETDVPQQLTDKEF